MFLKTFNVSFQIQNKSIGKIMNDRITQGIKMPCKCKGAYMYQMGSQSHMQHVFLQNLLKVLCSITQQVE
jgi:hypothetical protein